MSRAYRVDQLHRDLRSEVPTKAAKFGEQYRELVTEGLNRLFELHVNDDAWWVKRMPYSNYDWMIVALKAIGELKKAKFFEEKSKNWKESLERLAHYRVVIRKWGNDGRLHEPKEDPRLMTPPRRSSKSRPKKREEQMEE